MLKYASFFFFDVVVVVLYTKHYICSFILVFNANEDKGRKLSKNISAFTGNPKNSSKNHKG